MSILENILKKVVLEQAVITEKVQISDTAYRIRLEGEDLQKATFVPGSFLRMGLGIGKTDLSMKDKIRSYSVWDFNPSAGSLDIAIATHSHGIGTQWVKDCKAGETVYFKWKKGNFLVDDSADSYIMIGDLSALSHLYLINRNIEKNKLVSSIIYSQNKNDFFPDIDGTSPFEFYEWKQNPIDEIIAQVNKILPTLKGKPMVYIAGDSRVCIALNQFFRKELNWETQQIKNKPFWNPEKKGLE